MKVLAALLIALALAGCAGRTKPVVRHVLVNRGDRAESVTYDCRARDGKVIENTCKERK